MTKTASPAISETSATHHRHPRPAANTSPVPAGLAWNRAMRRREGCRSRRPDLPTHAGAGRGGRGCSSLGFEVSPGSGRLSYARDSVETKSSLHWCVFLAGAVRAGRRPKAAPGAESGPRQMLEKFLRRSIRRCGRDRPVISPLGLNKPGRACAAELYAGARVTRGLWKSVTSSA
jgi:hypothetical protein